MDRRPASAPLRCAYCHGELLAAEARCVLCGTQLHTDCRAILEVCPTLGCAASLPTPGKRRLRPALLLVAFTGGLALGVAFLLLRDPQPVPPTLAPAAVVDAVNEVVPPAREAVAAVASQTAPPVEPVTAASAPTEAITRGLRYLAAHQDETGAYQAGLGLRISGTYVSSKTAHVGVTALAGLAFLSAGSTPERGDYKVQIRGCLRFVEACCAHNGFITHQRSRMYSHAFATLFLARAYAVAPSPDLLRVLRRATDALAISQNAQGGWGYLPMVKSSDLSITVVCLKALRLAKAVGIRVREGAIAAAVQYVKRSAIVGADRRCGGFWYRVYENFPFRPSRTSYALTAAGVSALCDAGLRGGREVRGGLRYLRDPQNRPPTTDMRSSAEYFYGEYFAVQAFYQAGDGDEPIWSTEYTRLRDDLVAGQDPDGAWTDLVGPNYATAMACIVLQTPRRYGATGGGKTVGEWLRRVDAEPTEAARALGAIGKDAAVALPALLALARSHPDEATRQMAAEAVQAIRGDGR